MVALSSPTLPTAPEPTRTVLGLWRGIPLPQPQYRRRMVGRRHRGCQCQAAFAVESSALDDVEPLLVDIVDAGANEIGGVDFDVMGKRELRGDAA